GARRSAMKVELHGMAPLLQVFDMPRAVAFYRDLLGFELVSASPERGPDDFDWCLLRREGIEVMLNTAYEQDSRPAAPDPARAASHDDTCLYFGCRDLDEIYRHLTEHGHPAKGPKVAPYGMRQLYLHDPDGYGLCFQWPAEPGEA